MQVRVLLLIVLPAMLFLLPAESSAALKKTLLHIGNIEQWADLAYYYSDTSGDRATTEETDHTFNEGYTLKGKYAVVYPRLWHGEFKLDLDLEQESITRGRGNDEQASEINLDYRLNGILFGFKPISLGFATSSNNIRRSPDYGSDYDVTSNRHQIALNWRNRLFPSRLSFAHSNSTTSGLDNDRTITTDQLEFKARNVSRAGDTDFLARFLQVNSEFSEGDNDEFDRFEVNFDNSLDLGSGIRTGKLLSRFEFLDESGDFNNQRFTWGENLSWRLGKALTAGGGYTYSDTESSSGETSYDNLSQSAEGYIEHQLARSINTRLFHSYRWEDGSRGTENQQLTDISVNYRKQLRAAALLTLNVGYAFSTTERELTSGERIVIDDRKRVQTDIVPLDDDGIVSDSIEVFNADRSVRYREGFDYQVQRFGLYTELLIIPSPAGAIALGELLSIDYRYEVRAVDNFDTVTYRSSGSLSLRGGRLMFWYNITDTEQSSQGNDTGTGLNDTLQARIGMNARQGGHSLRLTLGHYDSQTAPYDYVEAQWAYHRPLYRGTFDLRVLDSVTWYQEAEVGGMTARTVNRLFVSSQYSRRWINHLVTGRAYYSSTQDGKDQQRLNLEGDYSVAIGKTTFSLMAGVEWNLIDKYNAFSRYASIKIRRYF